MADERPTRTPAPRLAFTKKSLEALPLPPAGKRLYAYDLKTPGLGVQVTSTGTITFQLYRKVQGRPERMTLGRFPAMTVEQAKRKAAQLNGVIAQGQNPADRKRAARAEMTLRELFDLYLERHARPHKKSWREDEANFKRYLTPWQHRKLSDIKKAHVQALHADIGNITGPVKRRGDGGPYAANRLLALLRCLFNRAADWGWEGINPAKGIRPFREKSRERFLQADELPRFFKALSEEPNQTIRDFLLISLLTGARRGNVLAMKWEDVNLERATWTIPDTKAGIAVTVPLVPEAVALLVERQAGAKGPYVFPSNSKTGHLVEPKVAWTRLLKRAGIEDLHMHDLRRTLGSWQASQGASLTIIGKSLGHRNVSTTAIYSRLNLDPVRRSVETATRAILAAGGVLPKAEVVELSQGGKK